MDAYLAWKNCSQASSSPLPQSEHTNDTFDDLTGESQGSPEAGLNWQITVLDFNRECSHFGTDKLISVLTEFTIRTFSHQPNAKYINESLARHGYIGATPDKPTIAFSFQLLRVYQQLHRVCPRLSLEALSKTLNHLHRVEYFVRHLENL